MKKFNFRLDKLLVIREYKEFEAKLKMAQVVQQKVRLEIENKKTQEAIEDCMLNNYKNFVSNSALDYNTINFDDEYINSRITKIKINEKKINELDIKLKKLKEEYFEARKQRRIIDELKKREFKEYKKHEKIQDVKRLDEIAGQFYMRKK